MRPRLRRPACKTSSKSSWLRRCCDESRFTSCSFQPLSDAPDAIPRFRSFILDLAVREELVQHAPQTERVGDGYLGEPTSSELPRNWRLLNFENFSDIHGGNQPPKSLFVDAPRPGYVRLFQIRDLGENPILTYIPVGTTNRFCRAGEILIGRYGASTLTCLLTRSDDR